MWFEKDHYTYNDGFKVNTKTSSQITSEIKSGLFFELKRDINLTPSLNETQI